MKIDIKKGIVVIMSLFIPIFAKAQSVYKPLVEVPGLNTSDSGVLELGDYFVAIFRLGVNIAIVLAVVMVIAGGIQYMVSEVANTKSKAKKRILNALAGLVLALASYLILNTINPNLTDVDLEIKNASFSDTFSVWRFQRNDGTFSEPKALDQCMEEQEQKDSGAITSCQPVQEVNDRTVDGSTTVWLLEARNNRPQAFYSEDKCKAVRETLSGVTIDCTEQICKDCVNIPPGIPVLSPSQENAACGLLSSCMVDSIMAERLYGLNQSLASRNFFSNLWHIHGAWPSSIIETGDGNRVLIFVEQSRSDYQVTQDRNRVFTEAAEENNLKVTRNQTENYDKKQYMRFFVEKSTALVIPQDICPTCVALSGNINTSNGNQVVPELKERLEAFAEDLNTLNLPSTNEYIDGRWWVTEVIPTTRTHSNDCHKKGECVDINFTGDDLFQPKGLLESSTDINSATLLLARTMEIALENEICLVYETNNKDRYSSLKESLEEQGFTDAVNNIKDYSGKNSDGEDIISAPHFSLYMTDNQHNWCN